MTILFQLNTELFRTAGILTLILYLLETLKEGYVSFFINPVWVLALFLVSGVAWLFDWGRYESHTKTYE